MRTIIKILLSYLLHYANREAHAVARSPFYEIKARILSKYGKSKGLEIQHIEHRCWTCEGDGIYPYTLSECRKCYGSGIYNEFWVLLEVISFGKFEFHKPIKRYDSYNEIKGYGNHGRLLGYIEGKIEHEPGKHRFSVEANWILFLLYDFRNFWHAFGRSKHPRVYWPITWINGKIFDFKCRIPGKIRYWKLHFREWLIKRYLITPDPDKDLPF